MNAEQKELQREIDSYSGNQYGLADLAAKVALVAPVESECYEMLFASVKTKGEQISDRERRQSAIKMNKELGYSSDVFQGLVQDVKMLQEAGLRWEKWTERVTAALEQGRDFHRDNAENIRSLRRDFQSFVDLYSANDKPKIDQSYDWLQKFRGIQAVLIVLLGSTIIETIFLIKDHLTK